uniref:Secreted protein n=1 Tax=Arundo donax TaxID=35708 RepID=A0A0A8YJ83_ARUDO
MTASMHMFVLTVSFWHLVKHLKIRCLEQPACCGRLRGTNQSSVLTQKGIYSPACLAGSVGIKSIY